MGDIAANELAPGVAVLGSNRYLALAVAGPNGNHVARGVLDRELDVVELRRLTAGSPHLIQGEARHGVFDDAPVESAVIIRSVNSWVLRTITRRAAGGQNKLVVIGGSVFCGLGQPVNRVLPSIGRSTRPP